MEDWMHRSTFLFTPALVGGELSASGASYYTDYAIPASHLGVDKIIILKYILK
jgi:hypothetical protein